MNYSNSMKALPILSQNFITNITPISSNLFNINNTNFQPINSFVYKNSSPNKNILGLLTERNYDYKNVAPVPTIFPNKSNFTKPSYNNIIKHSSTMMNYNPQMKFIKQRHHSYENLNILNINDYITNNQIKNENYNTNITMNNFAFNSPQKNNKNKISKIPHPFFSKKRKQQNLIPNYQNKINNVNYQFYLNNGNSQDYSIINNNVINNINIISNNDVDTSTNNVPYESIIPSYMELEPGININLSEYDIINQIGYGSEGEIYAVKWKKNNKKYALKKCQILLETTLNKRKSDNVGLRKFIESTGCDSVIKVYGNFFRTNDLGMYEFYEVMELAEKDWEKEILSRRNIQKFYPEYELMEIFKNLIKTFSLLQTNKITHRDIKPQNIMIVNGRLKICDFGNARILKGDGIIIQKIRGSELFMSPIVFKGYRSGKQQIRHNTYKSDVFSLGVCFLYAATLGFDGPNIIREVYDMQIIKKVLIQQLRNRYSLNIINLIYTMLQIEESQRPDFNQLELMIL